MTDRNRLILDAYLALWADPSPQRDLGRLDTLTIDAVRFKDPINDVSGRSALKAVFQDATDSVANTRVEIVGLAWASPERAFVKWRYGGCIRRLKLTDWQITGMSDITLAADGRIAAHEDHWDLASGLFEHFPVIGWLFRRLRHRLRLRR